MKNKKVLWLIIGSVVILCFAIIGMNHGFDESDAETCVEDLMKLITGRETETIDTSKYLDMNSVEDMMAEFNESMDTEVDKYIEIANENGFSVTDEEKARIKEIVHKALSKVNYGIGKAVKTEDGFEVPVTVEPMMVFSGMFDGMSDIVIDNINEKGIDNYNGEEVLHLLLEKQLDNLEKAVEHPSYDDPVEVIMHIQKDEKGYTWVIEDGEELGKAMFSQYIDLPEVTPESMKKRTEKLLRAANTGEIDNSLDMMDVIMAAAYYNELQNNFDELAADESLDLLNYLGEEGKQAYHSFLVEAHKLEKYEVLSAEKTSDGYVITVQKTSPDYFTYMNRVKDKATAYAETLDYSSIPTEEDFYQIIYREIVKLLISEMESMDFMEPALFSIKYTKIENEIYEMYYVDRDSLTEVLTA